MVFGFRTLVFYLMKIVAFHSQVMEKTNFENLQIYKLSEKLSDEIWKIVLTWNPVSISTVGRQIFRSADSLGANIAEGSGRGSDQDYKRFLRISRGSLNETRHWLRRAFKRDLLNAAQINVLSLIIEELTPKLNAYIGAIGNSKTNLQKITKTENQKPKINECENCDSQ